MTENYHQNFYSYWQMSRERPIERCDECGNVLKMEYVGPPEGHHSPNNYKDPETIENYVKPEYYWR